MESGLLKIKLIGIEKGLVHVHSMKVAAELLVSVSTCQVLPRGSEGSGALLS